MKVAWIFVLASAILLSACGQSGAGLEPSGTPDDALHNELQAVLAREGVTPLEPGSAPDPAKVALGRALFFDPILSGNKDISCATCHHPVLGTGDALALSFGTGGRGLGGDRVMGEGREFVPRNAPELFNRGASAWRSVFWDSRIEVLNSYKGGAVPFGEGWLVTPAGESLPDGLDSVLAAQAMFPVTSRTEMRGDAGDADVFGEENALAHINDEDLPGIWRELNARLLAIPEYAQMFGTAYPDVPTDALGFEHAANALAAFEIDAFTLLGTPWDRYLEGDVSALSSEAKAGALLFYGEAGCAACHSGELFTDQKHHNIGMPQIGPGKHEGGRDFGRYGVTGAYGDLYAFRTPPLRNVALSGPWGHDGAYSTLEAMVRHHLGPARSLLAYDPDTHLSNPELQASFKDDPFTLLTTLVTLDPLIKRKPTLTDDEVEKLLAFLHALSDPATLELRAPESVPSGLPVD